MKSTHEPEGYGISHVIYNDRPTLLLRFKGLLNRREWVFRTEISKDLQYDIQSELHANKQEASK